MLPQRSLREVSMEGISEELVEYIHPILFLLQKI
jgi:hypothetical protein